MGLVAHRVCACCERSLRCVAARCLACAAGFLPSFHFPPSFVGSLQEMEMRRGGTMPAPWPRRLVAIVISSHRLASPRVLANRARLLLSIHRRLIDSMNTPLPCLRWRERSQPRKDRTCYACTLTPRLRHSCCTHWAGSSWPWMSCHAPCHATLMPSQTPPHTVLDRIKFDAREERNARMERWKTHPCVVASSSLHPCLPSDHLHLNPTTSLSQHTRSPPAPPRPRASHDGQFTPNIRTTQPRPRRALSR